MPQARAVIIEITAKDRFDLLHTLKNPLPHLQSLYVKLSIYVAAPYPRCDLSAPISHFTNGLTKLTLMNLGFDTGFCLPKLTHLSLHSTFLYGNLSGLLTFISRALLLEVIVIEDIDEDDLQLDDSEPYMIIPCVHLRLLVLLQADQM
jgi:hypothetical protein